jgi:hypothetical protein
MRPRYTAGEAQPAAMAAAATGQPRACPDELEGRRDVGRLAELEAPGLKVVAVGLREGGAGSDNGLAQARGGCGLELVPLEADGAELPSLLRPWPAAR